MEADLRDRPFRAMSGISRSRKGVEGHLPIGSIAVTGQIGKIACAIWSDGDQKWGSRFWVRKTFGASTSAAPSVRSSLR